MSKEHGNVKHGHSPRGGISKTYSSWLSMRKRCNNPRGRDRINYGDRGVKVCPQWDSFQTFLKDMGERPEGTTIDRINNEGDYEPNNCRWASHSQQMVNRRPLGESGYYGVQFTTRKSPWRVRVYTGGKQILVGHFKDKKEAASAYDDAVIKLGLNKPLNFKEVK